MKLFNLRDSGNGNAKERARYIHTYIKPAKKYISIQGGEGGGGATQKTINFDGS